MKHVISACLALALLSFSSCSRPSYPPEGVVKETYIHKYGIAVQPDDWAYRGEHGQVVTTMDNGVVVTRSYNGGVLDGETLYTFPHSQITEKTEVYSQGNLIKETHNYSSGVLLREILYSSPTTVNRVVWYENGIPQSSEQYENSLLMRGEYYNLDHQLEARIEDGQGERIVRDSYGQMVSTETVENGQKSASTYYHPNRSPKAVIPFQSNIVEGKVKTFLPAGEPNTIEEWSNGLQHGTTVVYRNGERWAEIPYVNGSKNGIERHFADDGVTVVEEITWVTGQRHGPSYTYVDGNVKTDWYYQDAPTSKISFEQMNKAR